MTEKLECKGPPCSFLSRIPKYWLEPEEKDFIGRANEGELGIVHLMALLISGAEEGTKADRIGGMTGWSTKSVTGNVVVAGICKEHG